MPLRCKIPIEINLQYQPKTDWLTERPTVCQTDEQTDWLTDKLTNQRS